MSIMLSPSEVISAAATFARTGEAWLTNALGLLEPPADYTSITQEPSPLCDQCRSIFSETRVFKNYRWRSNSKETTNTLLLRSSEINNCKLCKILFNRLADSSESPCAETEPLEVNFWLVEDPMFLYGSYNLRFETQNAEGAAIKKFKLLVAALEISEYIRYRLCSFSRY
jgi:hypothetical protein